MVQDLASIAILALLVIAYVEFAEAILLSITEIPFKHRRFHRAFSSGLESRTDAL